jgi:hypothetical protein
MKRAPAKKQTRRDTVSKVRCPYSIELLEVGPRAKAIGVGTVLGDEVVEGHDPVDNDGGGYHSFPHLGHICSDERQEDVLLGGEHPGVARAHDTRLELDDLAEQRPLL